MTSSKNTWHIFRAISAWWLVTVLVEKAAVISPVSRLGFGEGQTLGHRLEGDSFAGHFNVDEEGGGRQTRTICLQQMNMSVAWEERAEVRRSGVNFEALWWGERAAVLHLSASSWKEAWIGPQSRFWLCGRGPQPQTWPRPAQGPEAGSPGCSPTAG